MLKQAVILCGGKGTRLGQLTQKTPKPLLTVSGKPFLSHLIQEVSRYGFHEVLLLAGFLGEKVQEQFDGQTLGSTGAHIRVLIEPSAMGTAGALRFAIDHLDSEFLLLNGDSWIDTNLRQFATKWENAKALGASAQMLLTHVNDMSRFGQVKTSNNRVIEFKEKKATPNQSGYINSGVYALQKTDFAKLSPGSEISIEKDIFPRLASAGRLFFAHSKPNAYFLDIGLPETYDQSQGELVKNRTRPAIFFDRDNTLNHDKGYTYKPSDLAWTKGAKEAIRYVNDELGFYAFIVSNQAGIARGYYSALDVWEFHYAMQKDLHEVGAHLDGLVWCPHHPDGIVPEFSRVCSCRKPAAGMFKSLMEEWPIDVAKSLMIGDKETDVAAGQAAGIRSVLYTGGDLLRTLKAAGI